jgi:hypothetical protein
MIEVTRHVINEAELPPVFWKARHFAVIARVKGRDVLQFRYRVNGDPVMSFTLNPHLLEMLEKLAAAKHLNVYALSERGLEAIDAFRRIIKVSEGWKKDREAQGNRY